MHRTRVKICGLTSRDAALHAVSCGADALGFVFYGKSPRAIQAEAAASIISSLPAFVSSVGLFVDADAATVRQIIDVTQLDLLQFHGGETAAFCEQFNRPYIKAVRVKAQADIDHALQRYQSARALLLDAYVDGVPGGTGHCFDWSLVPVANVRIVLAGGLDADNVGTAIRAVRPYGVDVSGGVESQRGLKDFAKIAAFTAAVARANSDNE